MGNDVYLPVEVEELPQESNMPVTCTVKEVETTFVSYIQMHKQLENFIVISKQKCDDANISVQDAKNFETHWYKPWSYSEKQDKLAWSQAELADAVSHLQQGQALMFLCQQRLAQFCQNIAFFAQSSDNDRKILANALTKLIKKCQTEPVPQNIVDAINNLNMKVEEQKRIAEEQKRLNKQGSNGTNTMIYILVAAVIVLAGAVGYLAFLK